MSSERGSGGTERLRDALEAKVRSWMESAKVRKGAHSTVMAECAYEIENLLGEAALADSPTGLVPVTTRAMNTFYTPRLTQESQPESAAPAPSSEAGALEIARDIIAVMQQEIEGVDIPDANAIEDAEEAIVRILMRERTLAEMPPVGVCIVCGNRAMHQHEDSWYCEECWAKNGSTRLAEMPPAGQGAREIVVDSPATRHNDETT